MAIIYKKEFPNRTKKRSIFIVFLFAILSPIVFVLSFHLLGQNQTVQSVIINPVKEILGDFFSPVHQIAVSELYSKDGDWAVVVKNLKTGESYYHNEDTQFESASLYKLWVMEVTYQAIADGKLSENNEVGAKLEELDKILKNETPTPTTAASAQGSGEPKEESKVISFKVGDALSKMITVSDNYAALVLVGKLGAKSISKFLIENAYSDSNFNSPPWTSARNIANFYEKLYKGEFIDKKSSQEMIVLLKNQQINDRIPKYLPEGTAVAHKTGELDGYKHDSGIVFTKNGDYIIVVLSKTDDPKTAAENIANFSKKIYEFEQTR